ncbi:MAG: hypothetical protein E6G41_09855 [Actinobacteria bacterium]|nr:MAG: hypothetical protein E6G41_09855 [Actinomycetota bacterium]
MLRHQQFIRSLALTGMAIAALIAPHAASARPAADPQHLPGSHAQISHAQIDLRTPDAVTPVEFTHTKVDLRSPDAATPVQLPATKVDLRTPDTQVPVQVQPTKIDLRSPDTQVPVQPTAPKVGAPVAQPKGSTNDFDFGSAAVGAGIALLIAMAAVGAMVAINRRRPVTLGH